MGPGHRIYGEEDVLAGGGIHTIERGLECESYWYARLGNIRAEISPLGLTFHDSELALLPKPNEIAWKIGRRHPGFRASDVERQIFRAAFEAVCGMLHAWRHKHDGWIEAYALKALRVSPQRLVSVAGALQTIPQIHEVAEISVIKYWYGESWPEPQLPDLVLSEFSFNVPLLFRRSLDEGIVTVEVMHLSSC